MDDYFGTYNAYKGATPKQAAILSRFFEAPSGAAAWFPRQSTKELSFSTGSGKLPAADEKVADGYVKLPAAPSAPPAPKPAPKPTASSKQDSSKEVKQALKEVGADKHASLLNPVKAAVNLAGDAGVAVGKALKQARLDANRDESDTDNESQRTRDLNARRNAELLAAEARKQKEAAEHNERRIKHEREQHAKREKELHEARERRRKEEEHAAAVEHEHALAEQARLRASHVPTSMKSLGRWAGEQLGVVSPLTHEERRSHELKAAQEHRKNAELEAHRLEDEAEQRHANAIRMEHEAAERRLAKAREKAEFHHRAADNVRRVKESLLPASVLPPIPPSAPEVLPHAEPESEPEPAQARMNEIKAEAKAKGLSEEQISQLVFKKNGELHARSRANDAFKHALLQEEAPTTRSGLRRRKV